MSDTQARDLETARAFASSWNNLGEGSVYTLEQFLDWMAPVDPREIAGREVIELGFGNGSQLFHMAGFAPARLAGIELGDTFETTRRNLSHLPPGMLELVRGDLTQADLGEFDLAYSIGVIHHLTEPEQGFRALVRHTRPGGRFHGWVYAREGNAFIRATVEPVRRVAPFLPWWFSKWCIAFPLVVPYFLYARAIALLSGGGRRRPAWLARLPLYDYSLWIARRELRFFHHVAFDQIVTPRTVYIDRATIEGWLASPEVEPGSSYLIFRNGNSWKFGGRRRSR